MFPTLALKCFPYKNFLYFFLNKPALNNVLIFSQKNLIFQEMELFSGKSLSYISRNVPFHTWEMKKPTPKISLLFREIELSSTKLKKLARPKKQQFLIFWDHSLLSLLEGLFQQREIYKFTLKEFCRVHTKKHLFWSLFLKNRRCFIINFIKF